MNPFDNTVELTKKFVNIPSPTGQEAAFVNELSEQLKNAGWHVILQPVAERRFNILATTRAVTDFSRIKVVINSHTDVVAPHIPASEDEKNIYGRGANETKGQIAVILAVAQGLTLSHADLAEQLALLFVVGEEVDHIGMQKANEFIDQNLKPDYVIVGEPTELKFGSIQKGALKVCLRSQGVAGHSGYLTSGSSAIHTLLPVLNELLDYKWPRDENLGDTTLNIGLMQGGQAQNAWAESASANVFFRVTTSVDDILEKVKKVVNERVAVEVLSYNEPVVLELGEPPLPLGKTQVAFNTDIAYYGRLKELKGRYLFGAGSITNAFSKDEYISKDDLKKYRELLTSLLLKLLQ